MKKSSRKFSRTAGFTLVEMLIVVAIISVLVAVSIPLVSSQLENARDKTDLANERSAKAAGVLVFLGSDNNYPIGTTGTFYYDAESGKLLTSEEVADIASYGKCTQSHGEDSKFLGGDGPHSEDNAKDILEVRIGDGGLITLAWGVGTGGDGTGGDGTGGTGGTGGDGPSNPPGEDPSLDEQLQDIINGSNINSSSSGVFAGNGGGKDEVLVGLGESRYAEIRQVRYNKFMQLLNGMSEEAKQHFIDNPDDLEKFAEDFNNTFNRGFAQFVGWRRREQHDADALSNFESNWTDTLGEGWYGSYS